MYMLYAWHFLWKESESFPSTARRYVYNGAVALAIWYWGGGGQAPQMYRQKKTNHVGLYTLNLYARASASETYSPIFSGLENNCMHIQSMQFPLITYGMG